MLEGYWWRPTHPDERIAGTLTYDAGPPRLRLLGAFRTSTETSPGSYDVRTDKDVSLVYGECDGAIVTLTNCYQTNFGFKLGGADQWRQTLQADLMLVGIWLEEPDEECFEEITIRVDQLTSWARFSGLVEEHSSDGAVAYRWSSPDNKPVAMVDDARLELRLGCSWRMSTLADRTEAVLGELAAVAVLPARPGSARSLVDRWVKSIQDLVSLGTGRACGVHQISLVRRPVATSEVQKLRPVEVELYLSPVFKARPDDPAVATHEALFTLQDVPFETALPAWFDLQSRLGVVAAMVLGLRYIERSYAETRLITTVAAAEGLSRRLQPGDKYLTDEAFDALKSTLLKAGGPEHVEWLSGRLFNEPTLRRRLRSLVAYLGESLIEPVIPKPKLWAGAATTSRNLLVHRFETTSDEKIDWNEVYFVAAMTMSLITLVLLKELGLPEEHLQRLASEHESFTWIAREGRNDVPRLFGVRKAPGELPSATST